MSTLLTSYTSGGLQNSTTYDPFQYAQTFYHNKGSNYNVDYVTLRVLRFTTPGTIYIEIQETTAGLPNGTVVDSMSYDGDTLGTSYAYVQFNLAGTEPLVSGTVYAIVLRVPDGNFGDYIRWATNTSGTYSRGARQFYNAGWSTLSGDLLFYVYGTLAAVPTKAINPTPADEETSVGTDDPFTLSWEPGDASYLPDSYKVYVGGFLGFEDAIPTTDTSITYTGKLFIPTTTWRVDSIYGAETITGDEWTFAPELARGATWRTPHSPTPYIDSNIGFMGAVDCLWKGDSRSTDYEVWMAINDDSAALVSSPAVRRSLLAGLSYDDTVIWHVKEKITLSLFTTETFWIEGPEWTFTIVSAEQMSAIGNRALYGTQTMVWLSEGGDYHNFEEGVKDADSFSFIIPTTNEVIWIEAIESLLLGTTGDEWRIGSNKLETPLSPTNFSVKKQTTFGSKNLQAMAVNSVILFVDFVGRKIRELAYEASNEKYVSPDLSELAEHLTKTGIVNFAYQKNPNSIVWIVLADGSLLSMVYDRQQDVVAWSDHPMDGTVQSVCVIPGADESEDEVWISVTRTNGVFIEKMMPRDFGDDITDAFFVDSGITATPSGTTVSGLTHLAGETVVVHGDGVEQTEETAGDFVVTVGGEITVPAGLTTVQVGLPFTYKLQPMRIVFADANGTTFGSTTRVNELVISFLNTLGATYGDVDSNLFAIDFDDEKLEPETYITGLFSGDVPVTMPGGFSTQNPIIISGSGTNPATVRAIIAKIDRTGR